MTCLQSRHNTLLRCMTACLILSLGAAYLCRLRKRRVNWQSAIGILTYKSGELLYPELCLRVTDDWVEFRGERIEV